MVIFSGILSETALLALHRKEYNHPEILELVQKGRPNAAWTYTNRFPPILYAHGRHLNGKYMFLNECLVRVSLLIQL